MDFFKVKSESKSIVMIWGNATTKKVIESCPLPGRIVEQHPSIWFVLEFEHVKNPFDVLNKTNTRVQNACQLFSFYQILTTRMESKKNWEFYL